MAGILRYGAYLPRFRAAVKDIHELYGLPGRPRSKTLATPALDEDPLTMAYEAAGEALAGERAPAAVITACQAPPFGLRKLSATLSRTLGLAADTVPYDLSGGPVGLLDGLALASALVGAGDGERPVLVVATDHLVSHEQRAADMLSAGAAAAFLVGADGFATLGAQARAGGEVYDVWRLGTEAEPRYRLEVLFDAYAKAAKDALAGLASASGAETGSYAAVCASQPHPQALRALGRLGVSPEQLEGTSFVGEIGNLGTASVGVALALGLDRAEAGQSVLALGYGGGEAVAQAIEVTGAPPAIGAADRLAGEPIALGTYYRWTRGRQVEPH